MKKVPLFLLGVLVIAGLASCGEDSSTPITSEPPVSDSSSVFESSSEESTSVPDSSSLESTSAPDSSTGESSSSIDSTSTSFVEPDVTEFSEGTESGYLSEIGMNINLSDNFRYLCTFKSNNINPSITFRVSDPNVITVQEEVSNDGDFTLLSHNPGNAVLEIFDSDEMLVYRKIIRVRNRIAEEDLYEYLLSVDKFVSIFNKFLYWDYEMTFLTDGSDGTDPQGYIEGSDDYDPDVKITFAYQLDGYETSSDTYWFNVTQTIQTNTEMTVLYGIQMFPTGDMMNVYYLSHDPEDGSPYGSLLAFMVPSELAYLHE